MFKQKGNNLVGLVLIICFTMLFVLPEMLSYERKKEVQEEFPEVSIEDRALVDEYKKKDEPGQSLKGVYVSKQTYEDYDFEAKFYFTEDGSIIKELYLKENDGKPKAELKGEAKYSFSGSTIQYEYLSGAKGIFSRSGNAITIVDENNFIFHEPEENFHFVKQ